MAKGNLSKLKTESPRLFDSIAHSYDLANGVISLGLHHVWRKQLLDRLPMHSNHRILDIATGTGDVAFAAALRDDVSGIVAIDPSQGMLEVAARKKLKARLQQRNKIEFKQADGMALPTAWHSSFSAVTISFGIRNMSRPADCLRSCFHTLAPGGRLLILESGKPASHTLRWLHGLYMGKIMPMMGRLISGHRYAYNYLDDTTQDFPCGEEFAQLMSQAGFTGVGFKPLMAGATYLYWGERPKL